MIAAAALGWAWWQLRPKPPPPPPTQKEISIKQADIPDVATVAYDDWSGFRFDYPDILTVKEVELDNPQVYSSLELAGSDSQRLNIRISDTAVAGLTEWQKEFNRQYSVRKINQTTLAGLPALRLNFGAPEKLLTVAIDNGIIYTIESQADSGFWNRTHEDLVASWQFTQPQPAETGAGGSAANENEEIILIEETVE